MYKKEPWIGQKNSLQKRCPLLLFEGWFRSPQNWYLPGFYSNSIDWRELIFCARIEFEDEPVYSFERNKFLLRLFFYHFFLLLLFLHFFEFIFWIDWNSLIAFGRSIATGWQKTVLPCIWSSVKTSFRFEFSAKWGFRSLGALNQVVTVLTLFLYQV